MAINKDKLRESAQKYLQKGQIDKAIKEFQRLVEDDPKDVRTLLKIGDLQTRAGNNAEAVETYDKVAQFYTDQGFFLKAVAVYKQVLKVDANNVDVNTKLAELYSQLGLVSDAQAQLKTLIGLHERDGKPDLALRAVKMMVDLDPDGVPGRLKLAELYTQAGKTAEARSELARAADTLKANHRIDDYVKVAERMSQLDPSDAKLARELATIYLQKGEAKHALAKLQVPFKENPRDLDTLELLATAFRDVGQPTRSIAVYKEIARVAASTGDAEHQAKAMRKVLALAPDDAEALAVVGGAGTSAAASAPTRPAATTPKPQPTTRDSASGGNALGRIVPKQKELHTSELVEIDRRPKVEAVRARPEPEPSDDLDLDVEVNLDDDEGPVTGSIAALRAGDDEPVGEILEADSDSDEELEVAVEEPSDDTEIEVEAELDDEVELDGAEIEAEEEDEPTATRPRAPAAVASAPSGASRGGVGAGPSAKDVEDAVGRILVEAEVYIKYGLKPKALEHLRRVFTIDPNHRVAKERYKNLLLQAGQQDDAVDALFEMAQAAHAAGDSSLAERDLNELLELVPHHAQARKLLDKLAPPTRDDDEPDELTAPAMAGMREVPQTLARGEVSDVSISYEPSTAAAIIDLDEGVDDDEALETAVRAAPPVVISGTASVPIVTKTPGPLPRKPQPVLPDVDDELDALLTSAVPKRRATGEQAAAPRPAEPATPVAAEPEVVVAAPAELPSASIDLSGELEEARFYQEQGLLDEARDAVAALLAQYPDHPDLLDFQRTLEPTEAPAPVEPTASVGLDHTTTTTVLDAAEAPAAPAVATPAATSLYDDEPEATIETGGFDLGADLAAELESVAASDDFQVSFGDVFDDFKKGVAQQVEASDHDTHYNLGIAYKEMGLFDDAIREFELATQDPTKQIGALTMMGLCALAAGNTNGALQYFQRGLALPTLTPEQGMALRFEIAQAYEQMEKWADAAKFYENVQRLDPSFRDVAERVSFTKNRAAAHPAADLTSELDELLADTGVERSAAPKKGGKISYL